MRTRDAVLEYQKGLDDAGTLTKDITLRDPVSALALAFEATNGATSNKGAYISDVITKIELVDGSTVLYSVNLAELEALYFHKTGKSPKLFPSEHASGGQREDVLLMFGRKLWDQAYAMDFTKFPNPQLKITSNLAAIRAVAATGFTTATLKVTIVAKVMEEMAGRPAQFLSAKQINSWTTLASGERRIDLPRDKILRMLQLRSFEQGADIDEGISNIKITADTDKYIALDRKVIQLDGEALMLNGRCQFKHDILTKHQTAFRELNNKENSGHWATFAKSAPTIIGINYEWSSEGKLDMIDNAAATISTDEALTGYEDGHALHATVPIFMGDRDLPETWFDPRSYTKLEAVLTEANAGGAASIVTEQVYPL